MTFFLLSFSILIQSQNKIYWEKDKPLQFVDFQGKPQYKRVAAVSYCGIKFNSCNKRGTPTYEVFAYFEPKNSWVWSNYKYKYVIRHEQLHFDIAELYTRKLRKYFHEHKVPIYYSTKVYQNLYEEYENFQDFYDDDTGHGTNSERQKIWNENIKNQLRELEDFAQYRCY